MNELMTKKEIEDKFKSEWILVGSPETDETLDLIRGEVLYHSPKRDDVYKMSGKLSPKSAAILYTGTMEKDVVLAL